MSKCNISIEIANVKNRRDLFDRAKEAITGNKGTLTGDEHAGTFDLPIVIGHIKGTYTIDETTFHLEVTHKPLLVSCKRIETEISKHLK